MAGPASTDEPLDLAAVERDLRARRDDLRARIAALARPPERGAELGFGKRIGDGTTEAVSRLTDVGVGGSLEASEARVSAALAKLEAGTTGSARRAAGRSPRRACAPRPRACAASAAPPAADPARARCPRRIRRWTRLACRSPGTSCGWPRAPRARSRPAASRARSGASRRRPRRRSSRRARCRTPSAGRTVLVTGASYGIGHAAAQQIAAAGATTLVVARSGDDLDDLAAVVAERGGRAHPYVCDLSDLDAIDDLAARIAADGHEVDVLVNNAARSIRRPVAQSVHRFHDFERTMRLNYFAAVRLTLAVLPGMAERGSGHVVNISTLGTQTGSPRFAAYLASKAALEMFTRIAAAEYLDDGVRFSVVHMPLVRTPMITVTDAYDDVPAMSPESAAALIAEALRSRAEHVGPVLGPAAEIAAAIAPAASTEALHALFRATERPAG